MGWLKGLINFWYIISMEETGIDFGDHDPIFKVTLVMFDQMISFPLSLEFRTNLVDCIIGMAKRLD